MTPRTVNPSAAPERLPTRDAPALDATTMRHAEAGPEWLWRTHLLASIAWAFLVVGSMSMAEVANGVLAGAALLRLGWTWRCYRPWLRQPLTLFVLAWIAWSGASLVWTPDPATGAQQWGVARFALALPALWPVLASGSRGLRPFLLAAMAAGLVLGVVSQGVNWLGVRRGVEWLVLMPSSSPVRNGGWWPEVIGGELLVVAVALQLPGCAGATPVRWAARLGVALALVGTWATGTRAAFAATAGVVVLAGVWGVARLDRRRWSRGRVALAGVVGLSLVAAGAWFAGGPTLRDRLSRGAAEVVTAARGGRADTESGLRVVMAGWALDAFIAHPVRGVGTGGLRAWVLAHEPATPARAMFEENNHRHAHNTPLHAAATTGVVGVAILAAMLVFGFAGAVRAARGAASSRGPWSAYDRGLVLALAGLVVLMPFDVIHVSAPIFAVLAALLALATPPPASLPR